MLEKNIQINLVNNEFIEEVGVNTSTIQALKSPIDITMNRREFLTWVGVGGIASSLPVAIAACSNTTEAVSSPPAGEFKPIGTVAELDQKGQILNKDFSGSPVLIVRNPNNSKTISAVNPTCTHKGCSVVWKADQKNFVCPCHGAKFAIDGKVVKDPAQTPLATYQAKIEGNSIFVKKG